FLSPPVALTRTPRLGFDDYIVGTAIVGQITFINAQKKHAVTLSYEFVSGADEHKFVIVVADYANQPAGWIGPHQSVVVSRKGKARRRGKATTSQVNAPGSSNAQALTSAHHQPAVSPAIVCVISSHSDLNCEEGSHGSLSRIRVHGNGSCWRRVYRVG